MHEAIDELGSSATFKGYGPEQGYRLPPRGHRREQYAGLGISADEVFISDGSREVRHRQHPRHLRTRNVIAITDPVYPVYVDTMS